MDNGKMAVDSANVTMIPPLQQEEEEQVVVVVLEAVKEVSSHGPKERKSDSA